MEPEPAGDLDPVARAWPEAEAVRIAPVLGAAAGLVEALALAWAGAETVVSRSATAAILPHLIRPRQRANETSDPNPV